MIRTPSYIDLLVEMLSIPAVSRKEEKRADFLEDFLSARGVQVKRIHNNLLAGKPGHLPFPGSPESRENLDDRPVILLNSHLDTVPPADGWTTDPFKPELENGKIKALGSNDAGASVVTLIEVFLELGRRWGDECELFLLLTAEEEVSGNGGLSAVIEHLGRVDAVVVGEPTGMQPAVAERGLMVLDAEVSGKAGHAARGEGENAIYLAMKDLEALAGLQFPDESEWLPAPSVNVTMISAGSVHNVIPGTCRYVVDVRSNDRYGNEELLEMIRGVCSARITPRSTRLRASVLDPGHPLAETIRISGLKPFGSSTLSDMALMPFPAVKMGPGNSSRSHTPGEYILMEELEEAIGIYSRFLTLLKDLLLQGNRDTEERILRDGHRGNATTEERSFGTGIGE